MIAAADFDNHYDAPCEGRRSLVSSAAKFASMQSFHRKLAFALVALATATISSTARAEQASVVAKQAAKGQVVDPPAGDAGLAPIEIDEADVPLSDSEQQHGVGCADYCEPIGLGKRWWARAEYLGWGSEGMFVPALITTSPAGTASTDAGVIGEPGTGVVFGNGHMNDNVRSGGRFELGTWFHPEQLDGIGVTYTFLGERTDSYRASSAEYAILSRPFFNVSSGAQDARIIVYPGLASGSVAVSSENQFQSLALDYRRRGVRSGRFQIDYLLGYMFAEFDESLFIRDSSLSLSGVTQGTLIEIEEAFESKNSFHGAAFGIMAREELSDRWVGDVFAKGALGGVYSRTEISGQTDTTINGATTTTPGGLLTQASNIGDHRDGYVSSYWELGLKLRRRLGMNSTLSFGYSWVLLSHVERAGEQIDLGVNVTQIPPGVLVGEARPGFPEAKSSYWAQGLSVGLECQF